MTDSIKLFSFNRKYCHIVGVYPLESNQNGPSINSTNWIFVISFVLHFLSTAASIFFEAKSMLQYGFSFYAASVSFFFMWMYLGNIWQIKNTLSFIEKCEQFIEKRTTTINIYRELSEKIELLCVMINILMISTIVIFTLPFLLYSFINYYILDMGAESFVLFFPVTWPFDWRTPLGYSIAWIVQFAGVYAIGLTTIMSLNVFFGSCWLFIIMIEDVTNDLTAFNKDVEANSNDTEWMKYFCDIIQLYRDVTECVSNFNVIVKYSIFSFVFYLMLSVTSMLLTLQFQLMDDNAKLFETLVVSILDFWVFGSLFFICEVGQRVSVHFEMFCKEMERCDWPMLTTKMQRMYLIFISDTQQPKNITCYGRIVFTRATYEQILKTGWSYFMTIRQFGS